MNVQQTPKPSRADKYAASVGMKAFFKAHTPLATVATAVPYVSWHSPLTLQEVKRHLWRELCEVITTKGGTPRPLPQYADVAEWLYDNHGKGLLLYGTCGQGKTLLARYVLPTLLLTLHRRVLHPVDAYDLDANLREYETYHLISIDDLGTEVISQYKNLAFGDLLDRCEKKGGLIVATTNLTGEQLKERYGERIYDRLVGLTKRVLFTGDSFRQVG